jgi:hypothetical protein
VGAGERRDAWLLGRKSGPQAAQSANRTRIGVPQAHVALGAWVWPLVSLR